MNKFKKLLQDWLGITRINDKLFPPPMKMYNVDLNPPVEVKPNEDYFVNINVETIKKGYDKSN